MHNYKIKCVTIILGRKRERVKKFSLKLNHLGLVCLIKIGNFFYKPSNCGINLASDLTRFDENVHYFSYNSVNECKSEEGN